MHIEQDYTIEAEAIGSSGRWDKLFNAVVKIYNDPQEFSLWRANVLLGLTTAILKEYKKLKKAYACQDGYLQDVAFHARNILELNIWIAYVALSEENARAFYVESGVDGMDLVKVSEKWGIKNNQTEEWLEIFPDAKARLIANVGLEGDENLDGRYSEMMEIAKRTGLSEIYPISNKILSKHAHSTAWVVMMHKNQQMILDLKDTFFNKGCWLMLGAVQALEKHVNKILSERG